MKLVGVCQYDGSNFSGFQSQVNADSVQDFLESAISRVGTLNQRINYAGRTDAGVHAIGQVFDFDTIDSREPEQWLNGINSGLPKDIVVTHILSGEEGFHSRFDAVSRSYAYVIYLGHTRSVFLRRLTFWAKYEIDIDLLQSEAQHLLGTHDFSAFRGSKCTANNPNRTIEKIDIMHKDSFLIIKITANAFLYNMVRIIIGTLLDRARGHLQDDINAILDSKDRVRAGKTAPAHGLFFLGARYNNLRIDSLTVSETLFQFLGMN